MTGEYIAVTARCLALSKDVSDLLSLVSPAILDLGLLDHTPQEVQRAVSLQNLSKATFVQCPDFEARVIFGVPVDSDMSGSQGQGSTTRRFFGRLADLSSVATEFQDVLRRSISLTLEAIACWESIEVQCLPQLQSRNSFTDLCLLSGCDHRFSARDGHRGGRRRAMSDMHVPAMS